MWDHFKFDLNPCGSEFIREGVSTLSIVGA
jgi:hypothetical protein